MTGANADEANAPLCDRVGCDQPWPGAPGRQMPGGYRITSPPGQTRPTIGLYCSEDCAAADDGRGCDGLGLA